MKTILFQGDSITDTGRSREDDSYLGNGYPIRVKEELEFEYPNTYKIYNRGVSGNRIVDLYARLKADVINVKPDYMSILIGVNDVWHEFTKQNGVDHNKYFKVYAMLIEEIKEALPQVKIMIMEPFALEGTGNQAYWKEFYQEVLKRAEMAKEIAEKYNLSFVPLQCKFEEAAKTTSNNYWLIDGVHPTTAGHELIKREWLKAFNKL